MPSHIDIMMDEDLPAEVSPADDPDDTEETAEQTLPLVAAVPLPARPATCPRASCLKRNVSGSSDIGDILGSPTPSLTAIAPLSGSNSDGKLSESNSLASPVLLSPSSSNDGISVASFKCFSGQPPAPKRQVHFADASPEAGLTWNGESYDRRPIESTQVKGSALDLSMRRCKSQCEEDGDDEAEEEAVGDHVDADAKGCALSQLALKVNHAGDYFGSTWARFKTGKIIGYDSPSMIDSSASSSKSESTPEKDSNKTALPTHSFRCFGGLSGSSILGGSSSDEEESEILKGPLSNEPKSADATPTPSPSVARSLMLNRSYFTEHEEDGSDLPPSPSKPELQVDTAPVAGSPSSTRSSLDADKTPTQSKARAPLHQEGARETASDVVIKLSSSLHSTIGLVIPTDLTASALHSKHLEASSQLSHPSSPGSSAHQDSASETSTSATSFTSDQDSPPLSWLGGSSGCTSPQNTAPVALAAMARGLSIDSNESNGGYEYKQPQITQEDLDRIPNALGTDLESMQQSATHAESFDDEGLSRLADRLAVADTLPSSCSTSSSPLFLTDDESVEAVRMHRQGNRSKTRSVSESYLSRVLTARNGMLAAEDSGSGSCSGTDSSAAASSSPGGSGEVVKKRKKKKCALTSKPSAFRCASFDDYEGALGGF